MPEQVPVRVARERNNVLRDMAAEKNVRFREKFVGRTLDVITLQNGGEGWTEALSDNYIKVRLSGNHPPNQCLKVHITKIGHDHLFATIGRLDTVSAVLAGRLQPISSAN